jgi:hypothetical protein
VDSKEDWDWKQYRADRLGDLAKYVRRKEKSLPKSPELLIAIQNYRNNILKLAELASLPTAFLYLFFLAGNFACRSQLYATGKRTWRLDDLTLGQTKLGLRKYNELWQKWYAFTEASKKRTARGVGIGNKQTIGHMIAQVGFTQDSGFIALMSAIIVGAWTSFESLAEELWVAALNARPLLAISVLCAETRDARDVDDDTEENKKLTADIRIPIWVALKDPNWKFSEQMGDLLRNWRFRFYMKDDVVKAYKKAFPKHHKSLKQIFDDKRLNWVSLVRNAIVHSAGRIPEASVKSLREYSRMRDIRKADPIPVNGDVVYDLSIIAIKSGLSLLDFIDQRIKTFPK